MGVLPAASFHGVQQAQSTRRTGACDSEEEEEPDHFHTHLREASSGVTLQQALAGDEAVVVCCDLCYPRENSPTSSLVAFSTLHC